MAGELSVEAKKILDTEYVLLVVPGQSEGVLYRHEEFLGAYQQAVLDRIEFMFTPGMSLRRVMRGIARLRQMDAHHATLKDALKRLRDGGKPVDPAKLRAGQDRVVAVFPVSA